MSTISATAVKFHFGLTVADLDRAVNFYQVLFGVEPVKHFEDYVKFDVADPPLVLALHPGNRASGGALNHVGFRVASSEALVAVQHRLELNGIRTQREEGVECCYARQTKFWVPDPDRNLWEVYTLEEDLDHSGFGGDGHGMPPRPEVSAEPVHWTHLLTSPPPARIPHADGTVDEVQLEGTCNAELPATKRHALLAEALRVLKPGGRICVHGLVSDLPFPGRPSLPGPAAMVQTIPVETEPLAELEQAGFVGMFYDRLGDIHCFSVNGVELREMQLVGHKPLSGEIASDWSVLYRGPMSRLVDEQGQTFSRGQRVAVDEATWRLLRRAPFNEHFTCFPCATTT